MDSSAAPVTQPDTPEERQAALTLQSARDVMDEMDRLQRLLATDQLGKEIRRRAKAELEEASERMCNLMALAVYQVEHTVQGPLQRRLKRQLEQIRGHLVGMGRAVMIEKLRKIHAGAQAVKNATGYPIGLASKLDNVYSTIVEGLKLLQGTGGPDDAERRLIEDTAAEISRLAAIEEQLGVLVDISRRRPAAAPAEAPAKPRGQALAAKAS